MFEKDTICALATPVGGAIAVIRLSGLTTFSIIQQVFSKDIKAIKPNTLRYGEIINKKGELIDDVVISFYCAPHSYTGEDAAEISCHGSRYIVGQILQLLIDNGCRLANPGEYTRRAYLNGKMDLNQAEAVADLIASTNRSSHKLALNQMKGHVTTELEKLREQLLKLTSLLELELDFSDHEDIQFANRHDLLDISTHLQQRIRQLGKTFQTGQAVKQGVPVAIIGKTNVGKSTLLNNLLHEERAIVSDVHGTTRDSIEDTTDINGLTFRFIDTAGIRQTEDKVEQIGISRTWDKLSQASIVLWVLDQLPTAEEQHEMASHCGEKKLLLVANKMDENQSLYDSLSADNIAQGGVYAISAKYNQGIEELKQAIFNAADIPHLQDNDVIITSTRQYNLLLKVDEHLSRVVDGLKNLTSSDLIAEDLRLVIDSLSEISGVERITSQETLNNIFAHFCIGK